MDLLELVRKFDKLQRELFYEQMGDYMDHFYARQLTDQITDLSRQIEAESKQPDAFEKFSAVIEELDETVFTILIANLDSSREHFETLYDIFEPYNNIHKSKVTFPHDALRNIKIKY